MDRVAQADRLKVALFLGQHWIVEELLSASPDLGNDNFGLECALYDIDAVERRLARDPGSATRIVGVRSPILHLAFSKHIHGPGTEKDMLSVAEALVAAGADVNDTYPFSQDPDHADRLSALYGAIGHADNMVLGRWLLEHGANPNDNESLYHSTELGHREGLKLLLEHGASPSGTNALPRALDFDDLEAISLLLEAGADPNEGIADHPSGEPPAVIPALHQAARRHCSAATTELLLRHGADANARFQGHTAYALARVHGNRAVADVLAAEGADTTLAPEEDVLAKVADGTAGSEDWIDMAKLSDELRKLLTRLVWREGTLDHMRRLVDLGFDANETDDMGLPPFHLAGWEGLPEKTAYFLTLQPDLSHLNGYGGNLFSTILHGSENCPKRAERDHIACMRLVLEHGVALPRPALKAAGDEAMAAFLTDWSEAYPGQVVEDGVV